MEYQENITGNLIKKERERLHLTQQELAEMSGISGKAAIYKIESGREKPRDKTLLKLCDVFECDLDYLKGNSQYKTKYEEFKTINAEKLLRTNNAAIQFCDLLRDYFGFNLIGEIGLLLNSNMDFSNSEPYSIDYASHNKRDTLPENKIKICQYLVFEYLGDLSKEKRFVVNIVELSKLASNYFVNVVNELTSLYVDVSAALGWEKYSKDGCTLDNPKELLIDFGFA